MEKQYIGARYVPILGGEWDSQKSYEALTIVQANNNSYTSKKPVPPGIDITNTEYWVVTGNFNSQVEDYRQQVEQLRAEVDADIQEVQAEITQIREEISNVSTKRRFVLIADSYGKNTERDGVMITGWPTRVATDLGLSEPDLYWSAVSGAGFANKGTADKYFIDVLNDLAPTVTEPEKITDVIVLGGYNDRNFSDEIPAAIETFVTKAKQYFPNCEVAVGFVGKDINRTEAEAANTIAARRAYANAEKSAYIANIEYCAPFYSMYTSDGVHPNNEGEAAIAKALCKYIRGGNVPVKSRTTMTAENAATITLMIDGSIAQINFPTLTIDGPFTNYTIDLGKLTAGGLCAVPYGRTFPIGIYAGQSSTNAMLAFGQFTVDDNRHLTIRIRARNADGDVQTDSNYAYIWNQIVTVPCEEFM